MAYPFANYPFRTHSLVEGTSSTNATIQTVVPFRSIFVDAWWVPSGTVVASSGTIDITVNGSTAGTAGGATGYTGISISSSSNGGPGVQATHIGLTAAAGVQYLNAGDVLATVVSSSVGGCATFVIREF